MHDCLMNECERPYLRFMLMGHLLFLLGEDMQMTAWNGTILGPYGVSEKKEGCTVCLLE